MNNWEIWWANVKFEDCEQVKCRPVLVVDQRISYILSFKITSHSARKRYFGEYEIVQWQAAGLEKPSVVRLSKRLELQESDFVGRMGSLSDSDIMAIRSLLSFYNIE